MKTSREFLNELNALIARNDPLAALSCCDEGLTYHPDSPALNRSKVQILRQLNRECEAIQHCANQSQTVRLESLLRIYCSMLIEAGRIQEAAQVISEAEQVVAPDSQTLQLAKILLCTIENGPESAILLLDEYCGSFPERTLLWMENLRLRESIRTTHETLEWLETNLDRFAERTRIVTQARLLLQLSQAESAESLLEPLVAFGDAGPEVFLLLYQCCALTHRTTKSVSYCENGVLQHPSNLAVRLNYVTALYQAGDFSAMEREISTVIKDFGTNPRAYLKLASLQNIAGNKEEALALLCTAQEFGEDSAELAAILSDIMVSEKDVHSAHDVLLEEYERSSKSEAIVRRLARVMFELGNTEQATSLLEGLIDQSSNFSEARLLLAEIYRKTGAFASVYRVLEKSAHFPSIGSKRRRGAILAEVSLSLGNPDQALTTIQEALHKYGGWTDGYGIRSRALLFLGSIKEAAASHADGIQHRIKSGTQRRVSGKFINSIHGHILNEFLLLSMPEDLEHCISGSDQHQAARYLRRRIEAEPYNTSLALLLLSALRRSGQISCGKRPHTSACDVQLIPKTIYQFWDTSQPPEHVSALFEHNKSMNPDFVHVVFNDLTARKYMLDKGETKALRSYQMAPHAAAKADILRLVLLWHEGGVYLDADDKCLVPFSKVLPMNSRFVGYQEYVMSVGNNFLATKPKESVIRSAIDDVARAFDGPTGEPIWLATGPGAITRAFARHFVTLDGEVSRDAYIMTDSDLRSFLASHVPLSYKTTERNWTQQFHRKK